MTEVDPIRLLVAAHELGHAIAWKAADIDLTAIRVFGRGNRAEGYVDIKQRPFRDVADAGAYLAGLLAGREAGIRWCDEFGMTHHEHTCHTDLVNFRRQHRAPLCRQVSRGKVRADARRIVRVNWRLIVRLAPRLARTGRISL